jgi:hypothetical protein
MSTGHLRRLVDRAAGVDRPGMLRPRLPSLFEPAGPEWILVDAVASHLTHQVDAPRVDPRSEDASGSADAPVPAGLAAAARPPASLALPGTSAGTTPSAPGPVQVAAGLSAGAGLSAAAAGPGQPARNGRPRPGADEPTPGTTRPAPPHRRHRAGRDAWPRAVDSFGEPAARALAEPANAPGNAVPPVSALVAHTALPPLAPPPAPPATRAPASRASALWLPDRTAGALPSPAGLGGRGGEPVVHVTIGRIEVRAAAPPPAPAHAERAPEPPEPPISLERYLAERGRR